MVGVGTPGGSFPGARWDERRESQRISRRGAEPSGEGVYPPTDAF